MEIESMTRVMLAHTPWLGTLLAAWDQREAAAS